MTVFKQGSGIIIIITCIGFYWDSKLSVKWSCINEIQQLYSSNLNRVPILTYVWVNSFIQYCIAFNIYRLNAGYFDYGISKQCRFWTTKSTDSMLLVPKLKFRFSCQLLYEISLTMVTSLYRYLNGTLSSYCITIVFTTVFRPAIDVSRKYYYLSSFLLFDIAFNYAFELNYKSFPSDYTY